MTPPAPIEAKSLALVIKRRAEGNWFHQSIGLRVALRTLNRKRFWDWTIGQSDVLASGRFVA